MIRLKLDQILYDKRMNTKQLSDLTGIRWATVKDMETNKSKAWSPDNLDKIMVALKLDDISELVEYVPDMQPS